MPDASVTRVPPDVTAIDPVVSKSRTPPAPSTDCDDIATISTWLVFAGIITTLELTILFAPIEKAIIYLVRLLK